MEKTNTDRTISGSRLDSNLKNLLPSEASLKNFGQLLFDRVSSRDDAYVDRQTKTSKTTTNFIFNKLYQRISPLENPK